MRIPVLKISVFIAALCWCAQAQNSETKGLPPRNAATDYQAQAKAGSVTIAAEFAGHGVPTTQGTFSTEDYVVVETGLFGPPDARATVSADDFSLRINGKKMPVPSQPYALILKSLKDPDWVPPDAEEGKSKSKGSGITTGGGGGGQGGGAGDPPPLPPKMPLELQRAMAQKVQKSVLPEGDRALPVAGLLFFSYRGKTDSIRSMELIYTGPAGKATLTLQR
jgi:hypothetical protein